MDNNQLLNDYTLNEINEIFRNKIRHGADVKINQYNHLNDVVFSNKIIDLHKLINNTINKNGIIDKDLNNENTNNCIMINIEKDKTRYFSTVNEFKKISFHNFVHLKATYWKENNMENDLTDILHFLKQFNPDIKTEKILINEFSETNDINIHIEDGPLACYCSHLRAMIYGYLYFKDYTIIVEDDILIANTEYIEKYIECIPDDWDILFFNSIPKNKEYNEPYYKFDNYFHSSQFYIIKNKCMSTLFKHMYPIYDQVDVLTSNLIHTLNIYNIPNTILQKNFSTNTQNNLNTIFTSPNYSELRSELNKIKHLLNHFINIILPNNEINNERLIHHILCNILYLQIIEDENINEKYKSNENIEDYIINNSECINTEEYKKLYLSIYFVILCTKKGIDTEQIALHIIKQIFFIMKKFSLHNTVDIETGELLKAYSYGSTCQIYLLEKSQTIIKQYNDKLRWLKEGHDNSDTIFDKEIVFLSDIQNIDQNTDIDFVKLLGFDKKSKTIRLSYQGESLFYHFYLPENWKYQIENIFTELTKKNIYYSEFRLENILILDNKIFFIDYGLANKIDNTDKDNRDNCLLFIDLLSKLNDKLSNTTDKDIMYDIYSSFMRNMRMKNKIM
jgi:tRNA A-37 threonylcarbamoyl transferase component Bud32